MAQAGRFLFVFGGEGNADASNGVFPQAQRYDAQNDTWFTLTDMPTPRHGTGAALVRGKIVVPGGADMEGFAAIATVESFSP